ncbi:unnamed protein product [Phytomonas sp. EM1]|nr:unnamed protein product [Phytomonas sp. EM1]|eukprot:CCW62493.1 unnamed protein product [Phytomonas sp. isolate EM1]
MIKEVGVESSSISISSSTALLTEDSRNFPKNSSQWTLNFKCKQRQYHGVLWTIQFIKPLFDAALERAGKGFSLPWIGVNASTEAERPPISEVYAEKYEKVSISEWNEALWRKLEEAARMLEGAPRTLQDLGPISAHHLNALGSVMFVDTVAGLLSSVLFWSYCLPKSQIAWGNIFPVPSEICRKLWPDEMCSRYVDDLRKNRAKRVRYYRDLSKEGHLCEAGLHSLHVFAGNEFSSSEKGFDTDAGKAAAAKWRARIDAYTLFLPDRTRYHELENLPQELAIGELVVDCVSKIRNAGSFDFKEDSSDARESSTRVFQTECVVDVGGGNGFLAAQMAEILGCRGLVVDPLYPAHSVDCCPRFWPDTTDRVRPPTLRTQPLNRRLVLFRDTQWARDIEVDPARCVFIAKHLCGTAVDECLRHLQRQGCFPRILILVPCCFNKGVLADYINPGFLADVLNIHNAESFDHLTRLTDWNESIHQREEAKETSSGKGVRGGRRGGKKSVKQLIPFTGVLANSVEALLNQGRMLWLQEHGYQTSLVEYVPSIVTPKNKCIIAYRV